MREKNIMMENGQPLSEELLKIPAEQFEMIERAEEIVDADFRTESVSYGKDVLRRFLHDKVTVVAAVIVSLIVLMGIAGPYMSGRSYLAQDRTRTNMPPRIPVIEKLGILDGTQEFPIVKDTTPNMMNPRLYTTSYNKPQGQQFDDTAVLSFIKLQYT